MSEEKKRKEKIETKVRCEAMKMILKETGSKEW
jgi:hypothetical protein